MKLDQRSLDREAMLEYVANVFVEPLGAVKHDNGKARVGLMMRGFPRALQAVAEVTTFGAIKYAPDGWQYVENGLERYSDALDRHLLQRHIEDADQESKLLHMSHAAWNALAVLELTLREMEASAK